MKVTRFVHAAVTAGVLAALGAASAEAAPVIVTVTGETTTVGPGLDALGFVAGQELTLIYTFDSATVVDFAPSPDFGYFPLATGSMTVQLNGYTASVTDIGIAIDVVNDIFSFGNTVGGMSSDLPAGYVAWGLSFVVQDLTRTSIGTDAFMAGPLFDWNTSGFTFYVFPPLSESYIWGTISSVEVERSGTVPEPASLSLLAVGAAGALARRRRGRA